MNKDMKKKDALTELVFILDRSGSMGGLEKDTIGGFNSLIEKQKKEDGRALVSTVLFDHEIEMIHDRIPLDRMEDLTEKEYYVRGSTALLDAVGSTIDHIGNIHKYARKDDLPDRTLFVITTDGCENSSCEYTYKRVKKMITEKKEEDDWEFLFLGANIDAGEEAEKMGIERNRAATYCCDDKGVEVTYNTVCEAVSQIRYKQCLKEDWASDIEEDLNSRK